MSNAEFAANSGGEDGDTSTTGSKGADRLGELPERVRVHALAKLLGSSSKEMLGKLAELGETARSPQSSVPRATAWRIAEMFEEPEQGSAEQSGAEQGGAEQSGAEQGGAEQAEQSAKAEHVPAGTDAEADARTTRSAGNTSEDATPSGSGSSGRGSSSGGAHVPVFAAPSPVFLPPDSGGDDSGTAERTQDTAKPAETGSTSTGNGSRKNSSGKGGTDRAKGQDKPGGQNKSGGQNKPGGQNKSGAQNNKPGGQEKPGNQGKESDRAEDAAVTEGEAAGNGPEEQVTGEVDDGGRRRRRRGRRGRGRGRGGEDDASGTPSSESAPAASESRAEDKNAQPDGSGDAGTEKASDKAPEQSGSDGGNQRRRRRRRRQGNNGENTGSDDPPNTVTHVRDSPAGDRDTDSDGVRSVRGSTRLEAKRQRRRDGREAGRKRAPILSEAEFLARRESVERSMVVAEKHGTTQIGVLEDGVLVEHFVTSAGTGSIVGNVYLGRVQNVLPSMEAAFIDIGRGRNAVLYAGEVDWDSAGLEGKARKIEQALSSGDHVLVQVTKDPVGHKGARLTTQISLPGRFLVYVPSGGTTGISRKLPENERRRLKDILKRVVPEDAGVIIRTASEGISEQELERDVQRLRDQWEDIRQRSEKGSGQSQSKKSGAPVLLYEEPDMLIKVVRDLFTEDFTKLEVQGDGPWQTIHDYVQRVAPELVERMKRHVGTGDLFAEHRVDEQISKALDRKVWLPSGGYLVIDRTEAMTVIDVNTGKFTGSGGNLEETVTRNNLESAEEIVRQLRLRDIGGIIVIDFIDMVLESNRELVLRRLTECLGRDRTRHQVAEVTSLGLVQMTRKRIGTGLLESFSTTCEHCKGRGLHISTEPNKGGGGGQQSGSRKQRGKSGGSGNSNSGSSSVSSGPTQQQRESAANAVAVMASAAKSASGKSAEHDGSHPVESNSAESAGEDSSESSSGDVRSAAATAEGAADTPRQQESARTGSPSEGTEQAAGAETQSGSGGSAGRRTRRRTVSRPAGPPA